MPIATTKSKQYDIVFGARTREILYSETSEWENNRMSENGIAMSSISFLLSLFIGWWDAKESIFFRHTSAKAVEIAKHFVFHSSLMDLWLLFIFTFFRNTFSTPTLPFKRRQNDCPNFTNKFDKSFLHFRKSSDNAVGKWRMAFCPFNSESKRNSMAHFNSHSFKVSIHVALKMEIIVWAVFVCVRALVCFCLFSTKAQPFWMEFMLWLKVCEIARARERIWN